MPLTVGNIVLRVDDLELEAAFWAAALGYERRTLDADDFAQVVSPDRSGPNISFDRYRAAERVPPRIHLDLFTEDQAGEVRRLRGPRRPAGPLGQAPRRRRLRDHGRPGGQPVLRRRHDPLASLHDYAVVVV